MSKKKKAADAPLPKFGPVYWDRRFSDGVGPGSGSEGEAAVRKADYINAVIERWNVESVVDWGCGNGGQLGMIHADQYLGIDVAPAAIAQAVRLHRLDPRRSFMLWRPGAPISVHADMALSLDVIFHLVDPDEYRAHIDNLFGSAERLVLVHATNRLNEPDAAPHMQHHIWTTAIPDGWCIVESPDNPNVPGPWLIARTP